MRGSRNTTQKEKKNSPKFSSAFCDQNFSSAFALKKHRPFLSTLIRQRKRKKWSRLPKVRALCSFLLHVELFFSLSFSLLFCAFFAFDIFFLFLLSCCVCVCVCVRVGVSSGLIFVSEFRFHFNHKMFSSHARMYWRFLSLSSFNSVCCIGAGYVGGPTMAMIALKCPHIEVILNTLFFCETMIWFARARGKRRRYGFARSSLCLS